MSNIPKGYNADGEYTGADDPTFGLLDTSLEPVEEQEEENNQNPKLS